MRIGIDFRFLSVGQQYVVRGIPRFTQEQLQSVLARDSENTYLLLCDPDDNVGAIRPEIRAAPNVRVVVAPDAAPVAFGPGDETRTLLARYSAYQRWVEGLHIDLYHATCHFWVSRLTMPGFDVCPYVVTAYDLVPLLYPARFQGEPVDAYERGLLFLEQATRIAAISQATADALVEHLGVPADRIDLTRPAVSPCFRPVPQHVTRSILASLDHPARRSSRRRVQIPPAYILCVTDLHYTKNLLTLLAAYSRLPARTRSQFPLVLAGDIGQGNVEVVQWHAASLGIDRDLIITGRVSDHELMALYNGATVMVHPSHLEGFGFTVAEAMRCGTPVITTTRSALPEVTGGAALLVDSEDRDGFTEAIEVLVHDRDLHDDLSRRGRAQAARFSDAALAEATLDWYRNAVSPAGAAGANATRVALWSPMPPEASPVAEYTYDLLGGLCADPRLQLDLFVDDDVMQPLDVLRMARVHHWSDFERSAGQSPYDALIYQHDSSSLHRYMEPAMLEHPGIVVLHDDLSQRSVQRVVDAARCCVTLTLEAERELQSRHPRADVRMIPIGVRDPRQDGLSLDRVMARAYLDVDPDAFVVVTPSHVEAESHIDTIIAAVAELRQAGVHASLAVAGPTTDPDLAGTLRARAESLGMGDWFRMTRSTSRTVFDAYLNACDAAVVLSDPGSVRTATAAARALAAGRCLVMSEGAPLAGIPDSACVWITAPPNSCAALTAALSRIHADPARRHEIERAARTQYERANRLEQMVDGYLSLIGESAGRALREPDVPTVRNMRDARRGRPAPRTDPLPYSKVCELEDFAHAQLRGVIAQVSPHKRAVFGADFPRGYEHRDDWESAIAVRTLSDHGALTQDARLLGVAAGTPDSFFYLTRHVGQLVAVDCGLPSRGNADEAHRIPPFRYRPDRMTVQRMDQRALGYPDASFDAVVARLRADQAGGLREFTAVLHELGRVLKPGGILSLSADVLLSSDPADGPLPSALALLPKSDAQRLVADASGLRPIDDLNLTTSHWTLATVRDMATATAAWQARRGSQDGSVLASWTCWDFPLIVLERDGRSFTSVHVALRRPDPPG